MHDLPPDFERGTTEDWFKYFRWTSYVYAMPVKFSTVLREAPRADVARRIMTGYAACALDMSMLIRDVFDHVSLEEMHSEFKFAPSAFLSLNAREIARLAGMDQDAIVAGLQKAGYGLTDDGTIRSIPAASPAAPNPKGRQNAFSR